MRKFTVVIAIVVAVLFAPGAVASAAPVGKGPQKTSFSLLVGPVF
jgi:hypothetical protein